MIYGGTMNSFPNNLKQLRKNRGITQKGLGKIINVEPITVSRYENGLREPSIDTILLLSDYFNISADELIGHSAPNKEAELLMLFYNLNDSGKEILIQQAKFYSTLDKYILKED